MTILRSRTTCLYLLFLCAAVRAFVAPQASRRSTVVLADAADVDLQGMLKEAASSFSVDTVDVPSLPSVVEDGSKALESLGLPADSTTMMAAGAVAAVLVLLAATLGGGGDTATETSTGAVAPPKAKQAVDPKLVAIPYDAAARLAYDAWRAENSGESPSKKLSKKEQAADDLAFSRYKFAYEEAAIAEVIAKKKARDMASFDPTKAEVVVAPRVVKAPKKVVVPTKPASTSTTPAPFFADAK
jgi:hypothetical protein